MPIKGAGANEVQDRERFILGLVDDRVCLLALNLKRPRVYQEG